MKSGRLALLSVFLILSCLRGIAIADQFKSCTVKADRAIPNPSLTFGLKVRLFGFPEGVPVVDDSRQAATYLPDLKSVEYDIHTRIFKDSQSITLPIKNERFAEYLAASDGIEVDDRQIQAQARAIISTETNAYVAACRLRAWVSDYVSADNIEAASVPISAEATLRSKSGAAVHSAVLYVALARAAGIPSRLVAGLQYTTDGCFTDHIWAESFVGDWIAFDPTSASDYVDATHIKLIHSNTLKPVETLDMQLNGSTADIVDYTDVSALDPKLVFDKYAYSSGLSMVTAAAVDGWKRVTSSEDRDEWLSLYRGVHKVGCLHKSIQKGWFEEKDAYRWNCVYNEHCTYGGSKYDRRWSVAAYLDDNCFPVLVTFCDDSTNSSNELRTDLVARWVGDKIYVSGRDRNDQVNKVVQIPEGNDLSAFFLYELGKKSFNVGDDLNLTYFQPGKQAIDRFFVKVGRRERTVIGGKSQDALVVSSQWPWPSTSWMLEDGQRLKIQSTEQSSPNCMAASCEETLEGTEGDGQDVWKVATDRFIRNPEEITDLTVCLTGVPDERFIKEQFGQAVHYDQDQKMARYHIQKPSFDPVRSLSLPISSSHFAKWLTDSDMVKASRLSVCQQASLVLDGETNAYKAMRKLASCVYDSTREPGRASVEAQDAKRAGSTGERQAQIMYSELARAAGIPTRFAAGLRYRDGSFEYAVWVENYVGEWIQIDPSSPTGSMDTICIKLYDGIGSEVFDAYWVIPLLQASVTDL